MASYPEIAVEVLKTKGFRITKPRCRVLEVLDRAKTPLSAYDIKDLLVEQGEKIDTVSVYRVLECLEENALIHRVLSTGKVRKCSLQHEDQCELSQDEHCHHLLICEQCNAIEEIHCPGTEVLIKAVEQQSQFTIKSHNIEFLGICPTCAN